MIHAKLVSFTARGAQTLEHVAQALEHVAQMREQIEPPADAEPAVCVERYLRTVDPSLTHTQLSRFAQQAMVDCDLLIFVGATGIAVRAIAPYLQGKAFDPAVLVLDEAGRFVIPLLSGHIGGANAFAERIAAALGAQAVVTTATDGRGVFAVDIWAKTQGCVIVDTEPIRHVSGALLRGYTVGLTSRFPVDGILPPHIRLDSTSHPMLTQATPVDSDNCCLGQVGIYIGYDTSFAPYAHTLHLVPRWVHVGIGCRKGATQSQIETAVTDVLHIAGIPAEAVCAVASIVQKQNEPGLLLFCQTWHVPFRVFSAEKLQQAPGRFTASAFVQSTVGVDNVCERAAVCSAGGGRLLYPKTARGGVTVALAEQPRRLSF